jgi:protein-tyrosine phosphatase
VNNNLIAWSDWIFVMEDKHKQRLQEQFTEQLNDKEVIVLNIPDEFQYMDEDLIQELKDSVYYYLEID